MSSWVPRLAEARQLLAAESLCPLLSLPTHSVILKSPFQVTNTGLLWDQLQGSRHMAGPLIAPGTEESVRNKGCPHLACVRNACAIHPLGHGDLALSRSPMEPVCSK